MLAYRPGGASCTSPVVQPVAIRHYWRIATSRKLKPLVHRHHSPTATTGWGPLSDRVGWGPPLPPPRARDNPPRKNCEYFPATP